MYSTTAGEMNGQKGPPAKLSAAVKADLRVSHFDVGMRDAQWKSLAKSDFEARAGVTSNIRPASMDMPAETMAVRLHAVPAPVARSWLRSTAQLATVLLVVAEADFATVAMPCSAFVRAVLTIFTAALEFRRICVLCTSDTGSKMARRTPLRRPRWWTLTAARYPSHGATPMRRDNTEAIVLLCWGDSGWKKLYAVCNRYVLCTYNSVTQVLKLSGVLPSASHHRALSSCSPDSPFTTPDSVSIASSRAVYAWWSMRLRSLRSALLGSLSHPLVCLSGTVSSSNKQPPKQQCKTQRFRDRRQPVK